MGGSLARDGANAQLGLPERPDLTLARPCRRPASPALQIPIPPREQAGITHLVEARIPKPNYLGRFMLSLTRAYPSSPRSVTLSVAPTCCEGRTYPGLPCCSAAAWVLSTTGFI